MRCGRTEVVVRYLFGFMCVCALGVIPLVGCTDSTGTGGTGGDDCLTGDGGSGGSSSNAFEIIQEDERQNYGCDGIFLSEDGSQLVLFASSSYDDPAVADEERSYSLRIVFDKASLAELATDRDYPVSGEASWANLEYWENVRPNDVTFVDTDVHTVAIEHVFFYHRCYGCGSEEGAQTIEGHMRLTVNTATQLAGVIEVRIEGDVGFANIQLYDVTLAFDRDVSGSGLQDNRGPARPATPRDGPHDVRRGGV